MCLRCENPALYVLMYGAVTEAVSTDSNEPARQECGNLQPPTQKCPTGIQSGTSRFSGRIRWSLFHSAWKNRVDGLSRTQASQNVRLSTVC